MAIVATRRQPISYRTVHEFLRKYDSTPCALYFCQIVAEFGRVTFHSAQEVTCPLEQTDYYLIGMRQYGVLHTC